MTTPVNHFFNSAMQSTSDKMHAIQQSWMGCTKKIQGVAMHVFESIKHFFVSIYHYIGVKFFGNQHIVTPSVNVPAASIAQVIPVPATNPVPTKVNPPLVPPVNQFTAKSQLEGKEITVPFGLLNLKEAKNIRSFERVTIPLKASEGLIEIEARQLIKKLVSEIDPSGKLANDNMPRRGQNAAVCIMELWKSGRIRETQPKALAVTAPSLGVSMNVIFYVISEEKELEKQKELFKELLGYLQQPVVLVQKSIAEMHQRLTPKATFDIQFRHFMNKAREAILDEMVEEDYKKHLSDAKKALPLTLEDQAEMTHIRNGLIIELYNQGVSGFDSILAKEDPNTVNIESKRCKAILDEIKSPLFFKKLMKKFIEEINQGNQRWIQGEVFHQWLEENKNKTKYSQTLKFTEADFYYNPKGKYPTYYPQPNQAQKDKKVPYLTEKAAIGLFYAFECVRVE